MMLLRISILVSFLISSSLAQTSPTGISFNFTTIDSATCVSPANYLTCYAAAVVATTNCVAEFPNNTPAQSGCYCLDFVRKMNCVATSCWNRIYGCEYQAFVTEYIKTCDLAVPPYPYWPAPANAPGACSCNLGEIVETVAPAEEQTLTCYGKAIGSPNALTILKECDCCFSSVAVSALIDICPATDPTAIGQNLILAFDNQVSSPWSSCGPVLAGVDCINGLGFSAPLGTGSLYGPTNTPAPGTQTLSDVAGQPTGPASGATFSWSQLGTEFTIVADQAEVVATTSAVVVHSSSKGSTASTGGAGVGNSISGVGGGSSSTATTSGGAVSSAGAGTTTGSSAGAGSSSVKGAASGLNVDVLIPIGVALILGFLPVL